MNILYLIGNGFDIAQGALTRYSNFYNVFSAIEPINAVEREMIDEIKGDKVQTWADLEERLGQFTKDKDAAEFEQFYFHLSAQLRQYLIHEQERVKMHEVEKYANDIWQPDQYFNPAERETFGAFLTSHSNTAFNANVISFNYTTLFEQSLGYQGQPLHYKNRFPTSSFTLQRIYKIHGALDGTPILGVNDPSQIANPDFAKNPDLTDILVKPQANEQLGTLVDTSCQQLIQNADLFILHGLSIGQTDNLWWQLIGNAMQRASTRLIHFRYTGTTIDPLLQSRIKRRERNFLCERFGIPADRVSSVSSRIYVAINTNFLTPPVSTK